MHLLQQKRENTSPSSPSPGGSAEPARRRRCCHHHHRGEAPAAGKSSRRPIGAGETRETAPIAAMLRAPLPSRSRSGRRLPAPGAFSGEQRALRRPPPSGAGHTTPPRGRGDRRAPTSSPSSLLLPPRPGANRLAPRLPSHSGTRRTAPASRGAPVSNAAGAGSRWEGVRTASPGGCWYGPPRPLPRPARPPAAAPSRAGGAVLLSGRGGPARLLPAFPGPPGPREREDAAPRELPAAVREPRLRAAVRAGRAGREGKGKALPSFLHGSPGRDRASTLTAALEPSACARRRWSPRHELLPEHGGSPEGTHRREPGRTRGPGAEAEVPRGWAGDGTEERQIWPYAALGVRGEFLSHKRQGSWAVTRCPAVPWVRLVTLQRGKGPHAPA